MAVTVLGRIGYDLFAVEQGVPLAKVTRFARHLGGSSANIAVGLSRLGLPVQMIGCIGDDPLGDFLIETLHQEGVSTAGVKRKAGVQSSLCLCEVSPPDRFPQVFYRACAADTYLEISADELAGIARSRLFVTNGTSLCASPSRESTLRALRSAKDGRATVAFDVDYRSVSWETAGQAASITAMALPFVDILLANEEELALVGGSPNRGEAISRILDAGVSVVIAKLGDKGVLASTRRESFYLDALPTPVLSTIGAGDGFAAGFLDAWVRECGLGKALCHGNAAASVVVSRLFCGEAMPRRDELDELLAKHADIQPVPARLSQGARES